MSSVTIHSKNSKNEALTVTLTTVGKTEAAISFTIGQAKPGNHKLLDVKAGTDGLSVTAKVDNALLGPKLACTLNPGTGPADRSIRIKVEDSPFSDPIDESGPVVDAEYQDLLKLIADAWLPKPKAKPATKPAKPKDKSDALTPMEVPEADKPEAKKAKPAKPKTGSPKKVATPSAEKPKPTKPE